MAYGEKADPIGAGSFADSVWINNGKEYSNIRFVELEMETDGAFKFQIVSPDGTVIRERRDENGGWHVFNFDSGMGAPVGRGPYKFRLVNDAPGTRKIHGGNVWEK